MTDFTVEVLRRTQEAEDIVVFELGRPDGAPLPPFSAGSHIDVYVPEGPTRQSGVALRGSSISRSNHNGASQYALERRLSRISKGPATG